MKRAIPVPQTIADEHTLVAQRYAGYFVRHPFRAAQQRSSPDAIEVDRRRPWVEPAVVADDCAFCQRMTDDEAIRRVAGFQHAIDIEVLRPFAGKYADWLAGGSDAIPEHEMFSVGDTIQRRGIMNSARNRRRFIELHGASFEHDSFPMVNLPLRLKRKLCIEWNHLYRDWLKELPEAWYDFEEREFYRDAVPGEQEQPTEVKAWWGVFVA